MLLLLLVGEERGRRHAGRRRHARVPPEALPEAGVGPVGHERERPARQPAQRVGAVRRRSQQRGERKHKRQPAKQSAHHNQHSPTASRRAHIPLGKARAAVAALHKAVGEDRAHGAREDVQRHLAAAAPVLEPDARAAQQAARHDTPKRAVPEVVRHARKCARGAARARPAHGAPVDPDEGREERSAAHRAERGLEEPVRAQQCLRTREEHREEVDLWVAQLVVGMVKEGQGGY